MQKKRKAAAVTDSRGRERAAPPPQPRDIPAPSFSRVLPDSSQTAFVLKCKQQPAFITHLRKVWKVCNTVKTTAKKRGKRLKKFEEIREKPQKAKIIHRLRKTGGDTAFV